jgi:hypothetical protein
VSIAFVGAAIDAAIGDIKRNRSALPGDELRARLAVDAAILQLKLTRRLTFEVCGRTWVGFK